LEITFLGGAKEVGKSALLVKGKKNQIVLDYGANTGKEPSFPMHVKPKEVHSLLLSHAHLDHSGGVPLFFLREGVKLVTTGLSLELTSLLLQDFIKLSGFYLPFEYIDILTMQKSTERIAINQQREVAEEFTARFPNSGHIPGGTTIIVENDGRRVLYTGDVNLRDSQLIAGMDTDFGEVDAVITEGTYALVDHDFERRILSIK
jgi:putative mRNA 3-end processing factor